MRIFLLFMTLFMTLAAYSQSLVTDGDVRLRPNDIFARKAENLRKDEKGIPCAVIMIHSTERGLQFVGETVGNVAHENATYYVYLKAGANKLEIKDGYKNSLKLKFPKLAPKSTYEVTVSETSEKGHLSLTTKPSGAKVSVSSKDGTINLGRTPVKGEIDIKAGVYDIVIVKSGYATKRIENVRISGNKTTKLGTIKLATN